MYDDFDEEAEARKRYPFLYSDAETDSPPARDAVAAATPELIEQECSTDDAVLDGVVGPTSSVFEGQTSNATQDMPEPKIPNYHYIHTLSDDLLPNLDFYRYDNLFSARPASAYLKGDTQEPSHRRLFSDFWLEGELAILFADTGRGKSVLAVEIGRSIALGEPLPPFELEVPAQRVAYFDFELTDSQFRLRYTSEDTALEFPDNFIRCPPRNDFDIPPEFKDYSQFLVASLIEFIEFSAAKVVIVDNITWLNPTIEHSVPALRLMKALHTLKKRLGLSILVLAHTPKRSLGAALTVNHLQGSKMLANFADNIFAIGSSWRSRNLRYLKHIKPRNCELRYDALNVPIMRLEKKDGFLGFSFVEFARERDQIDWYRDPDFDRSGVINRVHELTAEGRSQREIASELGIGVGTVNRYLRIKGV